ncbi:MAG: hypothetical protein AAF658_05110, partial [Myxococcota bacterium]
MSESLLSVDVESAIRKLTDSQLVRSEMRAVELCRVLFRGGAESLSMSAGRESLDVKAPGVVVQREQLDLLVATHDAERSTKERYAALLRLEELGGLLWLALATDRGFVLDARIVRGCVRVDVAPGHASLSFREDDGPPFCRVQLRRRTRGKAERILLEDYLKHARRPVDLDGRDLRRAPKETVPPLSGRVKGPGFVGTVRLRVGEDFSRIRWVENEVLSAERFSQLAGGVAHDAVIHAREASVRTRAVIAVRDLREATVVGLHRVYDGLDEAHRGPVRTVMFARAIDRADVAVLGEARVFETQGGERLGCSELGKLNTPVPVASMDARCNASPHTLLLDPQGRRLVAELLRVPIVGATRVSEGSAWQRMRERVAERIRAVSEGGRAVWARAIRGRPVPFDELLPAERAFMGQICRLLEDGSYRVPRLSPQVSKSVA